MDASYPASEVARAQHTREEATQIALETVAEGGPLACVLEFLCRTMEDESVDRVIACIHPLNDDATMFRDTAAPSLDKSYREATDGMLVSSMTGPCCHAVITRQTVVVPEVAADPKWAKFQAFAEPLGIRSCWSTPIFSNDGKVLGTFAHYYFEARDPSPRDERLVELMTVLRRLLSSGAGRKRRCGSSTKRWSSAFKPRRGSGCKYGTSRRICW
jgi:GAF domain-containing protein